MTSAFSSSSASDRRYGITHALLISQAAAQYRLPGLPGLASSIDALSAVLGEQHRFSIAELQDPPREAAIGSIEALIEDIGPEDTLFLYWGGHSTGSSGRRLALATADGSGLRLRSLSDLLGRFATRVFLVLDTALPAAAAERYPWSSQTIVICSTSGNGEANDGKFTSLLARGMSGEADLNQDGWVDAGELWSFLSESLAGSPSTPAAQRPMLFAPFDPAELVLTRAISARGARVRRSMTELPRQVEPFVDRVDSALQLTDMLTKDTARLDRPRVVGLTGSAGMGKTQLAIRVANEVRFRYPNGVLYVSAEAGIDSAMLRCAHMLGYRGSSAWPETPYYLSHATRDLSLLIVIDDVDSDTGSGDLWWSRLGDQCGVLVIGRDIFSAVSPAATVTLGPLPSEDAQALVRIVAEASGRTPTESFIGNIGANNPLYLRLLAGSDEVEMDPVASPESIEQTLDRVYRALSQPAQALFTRATVLETPAIDNELAEQLVEGIDASKTISELVAKSLFAALPDGCADYLNEQVRAYARQQLIDLTEEEVTQLRARIHRWILINRQRPPEPRIARDYWTTVDELNYSAYADAIAAFIRHPSTLPPLTIGVKGAWGTGKTSFMRMVQERLDPPIDDAGARARITLATRLNDSLPKYRLFRRRPENAQPEAKVTNAEILGAAQSGAQTKAPELHAKPGADQPLTNVDWHPTVWFNPWIYQSGEQIWAGLAHEIIHQITDRLPTGDRERFWLELNLRRINHDAVRRRVYRAMWERVLPAIVTLAVVAGLAIVAFVIGRLAELHWVKFLGYVFGSGGLVTILVGVGAAFRFLAQRAGGPLASLLEGPEFVKTGYGRARRVFASTFDELFEDPGYGARLGFLHLVHTDMKRVLALVAREDRPLVIFVDDLDRCSPGTVAQVIEAINLFLAGEFPNCLFVLAFDPALVAAHIEVTYKDLVGKVEIGQIAGVESTLGWRFLEKIVQLPMSLPPPAMMMGSIARYVRSLMNTNTSRPGQVTTSSVAIGPADTRGGPSAELRSGGRKVEDSSLERSNNSDGRATPRTAVLDDALVERLVEAIRARNPVIATLPDIARRAQSDIVPGANPEALLLETTHAVDQVFADLYSDEDALTSIEAALPALESFNPREIKRYINLFRFYTFIVQRQRLDGLAAPPGDGIAKLAALAIRWPQLLSILGRATQESSDGAQVTLMGQLEDAARDLTPVKWRAVLEANGIVRQYDDGTVEPLPGWSEHLRAFLANGPSIGDIALRLL